jgi:hypothetical protein
MNKWKINQYRPLLRDFIVKKIKISPHRFFKIDEKKFYKTVFLLIHFEDYVLSKYDPPKKFPKIIFFQG